MPRELQAVLAVVAVLVVAWLGYGALFGEDAATHLTLDTVSGVVQRVDDQGRAVEAQAGEILRPRERVVAGEGGRAVITLGPDSRLTIEERSTVRVVSADARGVQLELEGGRVQATVRPGGRKVGIGAGGRNISAEDADFDIVRGEDGTIGVEAGRGSVELLGFAGVERLSAGDRLVAVDGGAPQVTPASEELLLSVAWPDGARTRASTVEVRGRTEPGARVLAKGAAGNVEGRADANGDFVLSVPLEEGENTVNVEAFSLMGRSVAVTSTFVRDTRAPSLGVEIRY